MKRYLLDKNCPRVLAHFGVDVAAALHRAGAPEDTFARETPTMTAAHYFAFMQAIGDMSPDEDVALKMASANGIEQFSPPANARPTTRHAGSASAAARCSASSAPRARRSKSSSTTRASFWPSITCRTRRWERTKSRTCWDTWS
jgi:hypothetical protein